VNRFKSLPGITQIAVAAVLVFAASCGITAGLSLVFLGSEATPTQAANQAGPTQGAATAPIAPTETQNLPTDTPQPTDAPQPTDTPRPIDTPVPTSTPVPTQTPLPTPARTEAQVISVVDGDTIEVSIDGDIYRLQYIGIDAPEWDEPLGAEAAAANEQLVAGQTVALEKDVSDTDRYDRLLRYVFLADGTFVNAELVRLGWATAKPYAPDIKYQDLLAGMEQEARGAQSAMWAPTPAQAPEPTLSAPTPPATGLQDVTVDLSCSQFDAPGDDNQNQAEEWVCFRNAGDAPADMSGWTLHDEYGWTYSFPSFVLSPGKTVRVATGCGTDTAEILYWCYGNETAIWNNRGDTVYLLDAEGNPVAVQSY
jgi:endonuclease YncB( thermonuclease family)